MGKIKIGTCGYGYYNPPGNWKERYESKLQAYSHAFEVVELNRTFYKLPMVKTAQRWCREVVRDFEFTLKAWQAVTHPESSPTWRKRKEKLTEKQKKLFGHVRPNEEVIKAWNQTMERAEALRAGVCVIQTPASFTCTARNEENLRNFILNVDKKNIIVAWEPRGDWNDSPEKIEKICQDLHLVHIVDLLRRDPLSRESNVYVRLHGLNPKEHDVYYDYSYDELEKLARKLKGLAADHEVVYCMFNNTEMFDNAKKLMDIL